MTTSFGEMFHFLGIGDYWGAVFALRNTCENFSECEALGRCGVVGVAHCLRREFRDGTFDFADKTKGELIPEFEVWYDEFMAERSQQSDMAIPFDRDASCVFHSAAG